MIIRTMAKALVQCSARTQAGWMTLALADAVCSSLTVRADISIPRLNWVFDLYARNRANVTAVMLSDRCTAGIGFTKKRAGLPRLANPHALLGPVRGARELRTPASARCRPHGSRRSTDRRSRS